MSGRGTGVLPSRRGRPPRLGAGQRVEEYALGVRVARVGMRERVCRHVEHGESRRRRVQCGELRAREREEDERKTRVQEWIGQLSSGTAN